MQDTKDKSETAAIPGATSGAGAIPLQRLDELAQMIRAYNQVTENLRRSHESLQAEVERLQAQLASTDAQLQRSRRLAALGEMAAGIAHEIRNPLGAIQLYAGMIAQDLDAVVGQEAAADVNALASTADTARKIGSAVRGLNAIVCDVLSFARDIAPRPRPVAVSDLFDRAIESHRPAIAAAGIRVERGDDAGADVAVLVDPELLHQALLNIVRNAVDALAAGNPAPAVGIESPRPARSRVRAARSAGSTLRLDARCEGGVAVLVLRDNGPGIAKENIERIFNPFFTTRSTGTGLGLAIVHRIVDAHGGVISAHNDGGAVFELRLPLAGIEAPAVTAPASREAPGNRPPKSSVRVPEFSQA